MSTNDDIEDPQTASSAPNTVIHNPEATAVSAISALDTATEANKSTSVGNLTEERIMRLVQSAIEKHQAETDLSQYRSEASAPLEKRSRPKACKAAKRSKGYTGADDETTTMLTTDEGYKDRRGGGGRTTRATGGGKKKRNRRKTQASTVPTVSTKLTGSHTDDTETIIFFNDDYEIIRFPPYRPNKGPRPNANRQRASSMSKQARTKTDVKGTNNTFARKSDCTDTNTAYTWTDCASFLDEQAYSAVAYLASSALDLATYTSKVAATGLLRGAATALGAGLVYDLYTGGDGSTAVETMSKLGSLATDVMGSAATGLSGYMTGTGTSL